MTDLKLVSPEPPTPFAQRLMGAAASESPAAEQRLRVRRALGLPPLVVAPPALSPALPRALYLKGAAGALLAASAAALLLLFASPWRGPAQFAPKPVLPVAAGASTLAPQPVPFSAPVSVTVPVASPAPKAMRNLRRSAAATPAAPILNADSGEQLQLIEAARAALAAGDASAATAAIARYRTRFPHGAFGQEATVLQIGAADLQGNHTHAASLAHGFLARHPNSPHVGVVQRLAARAQ